MAQTLLVGIDGSESSARAAEFATQRAKEADARLVAAYVIEWSPYTFNTAEENEVRHKRREQEISRAQAEFLHPLVAAIQKQGIEAVGVVQHGHAAEVLSRLAKEYQAGQVIVGRRGISPVKALLFGSVTGSLVQISPVPVTVIP